MPDDEDRLTTHRSEPKTVATSAGEVTIGLVRTDITSASGTTVEGAPRVTIGGLGPDGVRFTVDQARAFAAHLAAVAAQAESQDAGEEDGTEVWRNVPEGGGES